MRKRKSLGTRIKEQTKVQSIQNSDQNPKPILSEGERGSGIERGRRRGKEEARERNYF